MKKITYTPEGVCSSQIDAEIDNDGRIVSVVFTGGCPGNTCGLSMLVRGMAVSDVIARLNGITCGSKNTSCPDQLARALKEFV